MSISTDFTISPAHNGPDELDALHRFIEKELGFRMPRRALTRGHDAPFDYIAHSFFEMPRDRPERTAPDSIVWANRGGGKTQLGAIVTLLDLLFKSGIQIRILGGSRDQSSRMYAHLRTLLARPPGADQVDAAITARGVTLRNGSCVEILSQSQAAVRGQRVHKIRCDEVELFDPEIWEAAQLVTRSGWCGSSWVNGSVEAFSTMHRPYGLMHRIVTQARPECTRLFRWNAIDIIERCPPVRECSACALFDACDGRAKEASGFVGIDDLIQQRSRVSRETWVAEMLCARPSRADVVYPSFDADRHVVEFDIPLEAERHAMWIGGLDFGFRDPTVLLWGFYDFRTNMVSIVDELTLREVTVERVIDAAERRPWPRPRWIGADPSGRRRNDQTGLDAFSLWIRRGWSIRSRSCRVLTGIAAVTRRLDPEAGPSTLRIHPRCRSLIRSLECYHYAPNAPSDDIAPVKDGMDHHADALRYLVTSLDAVSWDSRFRSY